MVSTLAGSGSNSSIDGIGTTACFHGSIGIAYDDMGNLYVADLNNNKIRKIAIATDVIRILRK